MSTFTFNVYLVQDIDGDGTNDYVLQDEGRIIISTRSITVDTNFRYIGGQIARKPGSRPAFTFKIKKRPDNTWYLIVNEATFCGLYANQDDCFGVLYGYYTSFNGSDDGFAVWLADSLERGSVIDAAFNRMDTEYSSPSLVISVSEFDYSEAIANAVNAPTFPNILQLGYQTSTDGTNWDNATPTSTAIEAGETEKSTTVAWGVIPDDVYVRSVLYMAYAGDGLQYEAVVVDSSPIIKNDNNEPLSGITLSISDADVEGNPIYVGGYAEAYPDESGAVLDIGETITYDAYQWFREIPELTDLTNDATTPEPPSTLIGKLTYVFGGDENELSEEPIIEGTLQSMRERGVGGGTVGTSSLIRFSPFEATTEFSTNYTAYDDATGWNAAWVANNDHFFRIFMDTGSGLTQIGGDNFRNVPPDTDGITLGVQGNYLQLSTGQWDATIPARQNATLVLEHHKGSS